MDSILKLAEVLESIGISPNVSDSNLEAANLVDTTSSIAGALDRLARAIVVCFPPENVEIPDRYYELLGLKKKTEKESTK